MPSLTASDRKFTFARRSFVLQNTFEVETQKNLQWCTYFLITCIKVYFRLDNFRNHEDKIYNVSNELAMQEVTETLIKDIIQAQLSSANQVPFLQ